MPSNQSLANRVKLKKYTTLQKDASNFFKEIQWQGVIAYNVFLVILTISGAYAGKVVYER